MNATATKSRRVYLLLAFLALACLIYFTHQRAETRMLGTVGHFTKFIGGASIGDAAMTDDGVLITALLPVNVPAFELLGNIVMGLSTTTPALLATDPHLSIVETPNGFTTNLSTEGTIDWWAPGLGAPTGISMPCSASSVRKRNSSGQLACFAITPFSDDNPGNLSLTQAANCGSNIVWTGNQATGLTPTPPQVVGQGYCWFWLFTQNTGRDGLNIVIPINATGQQVVRIYFSYGNVNNMVCTASLTDGSVPPVATPPNSPGTTFIPELETITVAPKTKSSSLNVVCGANVVSGQTGNFALHGITISPT